MRTEASRLWSWVRAAHIALCGLLCVFPSCATTKPQPDQVPLWVVDDGSHNGIVLPLEVAPVRPDIHSPVPAVGARYVEYGFSDRDWMLGRGPTPTHLWDMLLGRGDGVVVVRMHADLDSALEGRKSQPIRTDSAGLRRLGDELGRWIRRDGRIEVLEGEILTFSMESTRQYSLLRNCRKFTSRLLRQLEPTPSFPKKG